MGDPIFIEEFLRQFYLRVVKFGYPGQQFCPVVPGATLIPPPIIHDIDEVYRFGDRLYPYAITTPSTDVLGAACYDPEIRAGPDITDQVFHRFFYLQKTSDERIAKDDKDQTALVVHILAEVMS